MRLGIMQPYFFPYLGYFQLMNSVDNYVVYDNIQYTKKGWINRNRILLNGLAHTISLPLQNDSDFLNIDQRRIANDSDKQIGKILGQIKSSYSKSPYFDDVFPLLESIFLYEDKNLFNYILNSIEVLKGYMGIQTPLFISSMIDIDHSLKGKDKVIALCKQLNAEVYVNPAGGTELYDKAEFSDNGISLKFHSMDSICYKQNGDGFVESLSIIDVMMFNSKVEIGLLLNRYTLI